MECPARVEAILVAAAAGWAEEEVGAREALRGTAPSATATGAARPERQEPGATVAIPGGRPAAGARVARVHRATARLEADATVATPGGRPAAEARVARVHRAAARLGAEATRAATVAKMATVAGVALEKVEAAVEEKAPPAPT